MKIQQIRTIAKRKGINPGTMKKTDLVRAIQRAEGNFDCFGTASGGYCDQTKCAWLADCLLESALNAG